MRELTVTFPNHFYPSRELSQLFGIRVVDQSALQPCPPSTIRISNQDVAEKVAEIYRGRGYIKMECPMCHDEIIIPRYNITQRDIDTGNDVQK